MTIIEKIPLASKADLLYLKYRIYQLHIPKESNYVFAAMELGTNILKYAQSGYALILQEKNEYILAFCDKGPGIADVAWALQKGHTSHSNSLGLGLFQLSHSEDFLLDLYTTRDNEMHGTVALFIPKKLTQQVWYLSRPFLSPEHNGDFFAKKGKFLLFGDASGHNKKSHKSALYIIDRFYHTPLSCLLIEEFFHAVHTELRQHHLRSAVMCIVEFLKTHVQICGVGNIDVWYLRNGTTVYHSLQNGIVGETFSSVSSLSLSIEKDDKIVLCTDGIQKTLIRPILQPSLHPATIAVTLIHFGADEFDDASVAIITPKKDEL